MAESAILATHKLWQRSAPSALWLRIRIKIGMINRQPRTASEDEREGYVRKDGDNYVVEDDKDKTRYRVQNTETIREHEGYHVQVNARLHEDDRSLEVSKVKRLNDEEHHDH